MELGIVLYLILSILVGAFASNKGRSAVGFFFVSLLLSPIIGFLIVLLVKPETGVMEQRAVSSGESKKCPYCAEVIKREAIVCRYCGRDMPPEGRPLSGRKVECSACKTYVPEEAATARHGELYCPLCAQKTKPGT